MSLPRFRSRLGLKVFILPECTEASLLPHLHGGDGLKEMVLFLVITARFLWIYCEWAYLLIKAPDLVLFEQNIQAILVLFMPREEGSFQGLVLKTHVCPS